MKQKIIIKNQRKNKRNNEQRYKCLQQKKYEEYFVAKVGIKNEKIDYEIGANNMLKLEIKYHNKEQYLVSDYKYCWKKKQKTIYSKHRQKK